MRRRKKIISYERNVVVKKWGNSQGIRIPKEILDILSISEGDTMQISINNTHSITLEKKPQKLKLNERLELFYGKPIDDESLYIETIETQEVEWGTPKGNEFW